MSTIRSSSTATKSHSHHRSKKTPMQKFMKNAKNVVEDPNTWIGAAVGTAITIPTTCAIHKKCWLKAAHDFDMMVK